MKKPQYPLTPEAKDLARWLVEKWDAGELNQSLWIQYDEETNEVTIDDSKIQSPTQVKIASWWELDEAKLIQKAHRHVPNTNLLGKIWDITLLQTLRNAVENDFVMPEEQQAQTIYNAYGAYFEGNVSDSNIQVGASVYGNVIFNQVASELESALGQEVLEEFSELRQAIDDLRSATEADKQSKLGKVVSELGNGLQHGANAITISQAAIAFRILFFGG